MCNIVEHFINGLQQDCEQLRHQKDIQVIDFAAKTKKKNHLYQLLSELIDTERNYVVHLEKVSKKYQFFYLSNADIKVCTDYSVLLKDSSAKVKEEGPSMIE